MINSPEDFYELLNSNDPEKFNHIRFDNASEEVWFEILKKYPDNISWVILNKTIPIAVLKHLAQNENEKVRTEVAMKRKLDIDLFLLLSKDNSPLVRNSIACNQKTPKFILESLVNDNEVLVANNAKRRLLKNC